MLEMAKLLMKGGIPQDMPQGTNPFDGIKKLVELFTAMNLSLDVIAVETQALRREVQQLVQLEQERMINYVARE